MGRPLKGQEHPHEEKRQTIQMHSAIGTPTDHIARILGMTSMTLHKHYQDDLDLGASKANAVVGGKIFEAAKRGEQWACALWAARRMGWVDASKRQVELTGANGGPIRTETSVINLEDLPHEKLLLLDELLSDTDPGSAVN